MRAVGVLLLVSCLAVSALANDLSPSVFVGSAICLDCSRKSGEAERAFKGLKVAVKCKSGAEAEYATKTIGHVDHQGRFSVPLPSALLSESGVLASPCVAELHSASSKPCPSVLDPSKASLTASADGAKNTFVTSGGGKLAFSSKTCASAFGYLDPFHKPWLWHKHKFGFFPAPAYGSYGKPAQPVPTYKPSPGSASYTPVGPPATKPAPAVPSYGHPYPEFKIPPFAAHPWKKYFFKHKKHHPFFPPAEAKP